MTIDDKIKDEKLQYGIIREAAKISALSSGKIDRYEYLTGEETLPSDQSRIVEQVSFTYPLSESIWKTNKNNWSVRKKQIDAIPNQKKRLEALTNKDGHKSIYKEIFDELFKVKFDEIKELIDELDHNDLIYYLKIIPPQKI